MATVEDTHTRLCICTLRKIMLIFLSALFMGKSAWFNWVTWFNQAIESGRHLSLGRQLVLKCGKISNIDPD